ncbi:MAG: basic amino acid ABC transporter substrate-binding protein [Eubacterium sp.]|nr:basic amino acid ABC transporter substrate-binding protein [Eubacterium sp.]
MKKIVSLLMVTVLTVGVLTACGSKEANTKVGTAKEGKLIVGTSADFPPYEYMENNEYAGIDIEIAKAIGEKLGLEVQIEDMKFDTIIGAVAAGKVDMGMSGISVTEERKKSVNFSDPYTKAVQVIVVKEDSKITSADDLKKEGANNKVGVQTGTTGDIFCSDDIEAAKLGTVERYNAGGDAIEALKAGKIDCVVIDNEPAKAFVAENKGLKVLETAYADENYSIALKKGNDKLTKNVNKALKELKDEGKIQEIVDKYIKK